MTRLRIVFVPLALLAMAALAARPRPRAPISPAPGASMRTPASFPISAVGAGGSAAGAVGGRAGRRRIRGGRRPDARHRQTPAMMIVEQQTAGGSRAATYRLDGEESTNSGPRGEQTARSRWDGAALVTEGTQSVSTPRGDFSLEFTEWRTLSADGQTMTVESVRSTPRGDIETTLVYRRE